MITTMTFYNASTTQFYIRLHQGIIEDEEKDGLCRAMNALPASFLLSRIRESRHQSIYFNINGDRQIYNLLQTYEKQPEYVI